MTQDGHLVFQTGTNHNITFKSISGGYVNIDGENIKVLAQTIKENKQAIDQLKTSPTVVPSNVETRLNNVEQRLNDLQPTGEVQRQLTSLQTRISSVESNVPNNVNSRLTSVENSLNNLVPTGQVQTTFTSIQNRLQTLEGRLLTTNECSSNPCFNGGTCIDRYNGYTCRCPAAWQGVNCDVDVNECGIYAGTDLGCQNGATCINTVGSFRCQCTANWHGIRCAERHDDCTGASQQELCGHGTCINRDRVQPGQPKYTCICDDGWTNEGNDPACTVDRDECTEAGSPCSRDPAVMCVNVPGTFYCGQCPAGFTGNGFSCLDINECETNNGGCSLSPRVDCINTRGSRQCGPCPAGYQGNGVVCTWVGVCNINNGGCHPQATCTETPNIAGRTCTCRPGFVGNGEGVNGCVAQGSTEGPCQSNPCQNGAACQVTGDSYRCNCQAGYNGMNCETNINECSSNPCQNGGTCTDRVNGYTCQCTDAYTGPNCEQEQQRCGGVLTGETGSFRYPREEGNTYPHGVSCAWRIETTPGKIISATFPQFNIEYHPNCIYDFLQIHDGPAASAHKLGTFCGTAPPNGGRVNTTQHKMYLWFYSDASVATDGFVVNWISADPICGGEITGQDHGVIQSPGYPGNYPHNRTCVWYITVSPGNNIQFAFAAFAMENHPNCSYDYLKIFDGPNENSPILGRYCNDTNVLPPPVQTTSPNAYIIFHSDATLSAQGFRLTYHAVSAGPQCGGALTTPQGTITSPNFPSPYNHDASCVWTISVATGDTITLTFDTMDIEGPTGTTCNYDFVEVRDGPDENSALFNRFCGNTIPSPLTSTGNNLYITFRSDSSQTGQGFRARYSTACGGTFTEPRGTIQSPSYPNAYPGNKQCDYIISQPVGQRITLTFTDFDVEDAATCQYDYVLMVASDILCEPLIPRVGKWMSNGYQNGYEKLDVKQPVELQSHQRLLVSFLQVHDGGSISAPLLGRFCGSQIPEALQTTQNMMFLRFVSDGSLHNQGFRATYTSEVQNATGGIRVSQTQALFTSDCGGMLTSLTGTLTSPGHPNVYPHGVNCTWNILVPAGNVVRLTFNAFSMEASTTCAYDYVAVYDNTTINPNSLLGKYCGAGTPPSQTSTDNYMTVLFVSDSSVAQEGFSASYVSLNASTLCGSDLTTTTGIITSPNYPSNYPHNRDCIWTITAPQGNQILLNVTEFALEFHPNCNYDYLEIRNGGYPSSPLVGKYCGSTIDRIIRSHSNRLYIRFRTDVSQYARGFQIMYDATSSGCGADLTSPTGSFVSPNYPMAYSHNAECFYTITVAKGSTIQLTFVDFDLEEHSRCIYDYIEIHDNSASGPVLAKLCGSQNPDPITSPGNKLWIKYRTDYSVPGRGFHIYYSTVCNNRLTTYSGVIESPNFPDPYPHNRNCTWIIDTTLGNTVNVSFSHFDVEGDANCQYDYLELRDGALMTSPLLSKVCGTELPAPLASSGEMMWINFISDFSVAQNGFRLEWLTNGCGGYFIQPTGTFTSPNYPYPYPHRRECEWHIVAGTGYSVELTITDFELESHSTVYGGSDSSAPRLAQICHTQPAGKPQVLTSTGNNMFIRFKSDYSVNGKGFSANYKFVSGGCGGNYSTPTGTLLSKNYPNDYPHNTDCTWLITVAEERSVVLTFEDFDVEGALNCRYDYVALYDGPNQNATEIVRHCGTALPNPSVYRSTGNQMFVRMLTDASVSAKGFKASYVTDDRVILTFTHMDIENHDSCRHDSVTVYDGNNEGASVIGTYCGRTVPQPITTQGSAMFVTFVSDPSVQTSGFRATYTKSVSSCGGDFTAERGSFTSPGYPNEYPHNTECVWRIRTSPGNRVMVSFGMFSFESHDNCNFDYLEIREGDVNGRFIGRYCGNDLPGNITAANGMWIKFRSDESSTAPGFVADFSSDLSTGGATTAKNRSRGYPPLTNFFRTEACIDKPKASG
ncbi:hypothetical protein FSP39_021900 [Pinctada imbricata]|uniref:Cubilin n=1 Tax=Pinctada imbricata TaxID=66713 RepID=A0AA88YT22_PINIB|nr:hypothetical protein FSP39_021900 [Pinctada imbricata]